MGGGGVSFGSFFGHHHPCLSSLFSPWMISMDLLIILTTTCMVLLAVHHWSSEDDNDAAPPPSSPPPYPKPLLRTHTHSLNEEPTPRYVGCRAFRRENIFGALSMSFEHPEPWPTHPTLQHWATFESTRATVAATCLPSPPPLRASGATNLIALHKIKTKQRERERAPLSERVYS